MSSNLNCCYVLIHLQTAYILISGRTSLHITAYKDHEGTRCQHLLGGGGLTGYKCETCLGTGKPWSGLGSYNLQIKPGLMA